MQGTNYRGEAGKEPAYYYFYYYYHCSYYYSYYFYGNNISSITNISPVTYQVQVNYLRFIQALNRVDYVAFFFTKILYYESNRRF